MCMLVYVIDTYMYVRCMQYVCEVYAIDTYQQSYFDAVDLSIKQFKK